MSEIKTIATKDISRPRIERIVNKGYEIDLHAAKAHSLIDGHQALERIAQYLRSLPNEDGAVNTQDIVELEIVSNRLDNEAREELARVRHDASELVSWISQII